MNIALSKNVSQNIDVRNLFIFCITTIFAQWLIKCYYAQWIMTFALSFFPRIYFPLFIFEKKILVNFVSAGVQTSHEKVNNEAKKLEHYQI